MKYSINAQGVPEAFGPYSQGTTAAGDRAAIEAGALAWLTTTEVVLRRL